MEEIEKIARELVIKAGIELIKNNLIARTWGNISARISENEFVITPSGRAYEDLKPEDLVKVTMPDCTYPEGVKPSSEKKLHAAAYMLRPECKFIIHTHQPYATALSVDGVDLPFVPCAKYGLPGTKGLAKNVAKSIESNPQFDVFLFERHGALALGKDYDDAFNKAMDLEAKAKEYYDQNASEKSMKVALKPYLDDYAQMFGHSKKAVEEDEIAIKLIKEKNILAANYSKKPKPMNFFDVTLQHIVYKSKYSKLKGK